MTIFAWSAEISLRLAYAMCAAGPGYPTGRPAPGSLRVTPIIARDRMLRGVDILNNALTSSGTSLRLRGRKKDGISLVHCASTDSLTISSAQLLQWL